MNWLGLKVKCNETPPVIDKDVNGERTICKHTVFFQQKRKMCSLMSNLGSCSLVKKRLSLHLLLEEMETA